MNVTAMFATMLTATVAAKLATMLIAMSAAMFATMCSDALGAPAPSAIMGGPALMRIKSNLETH
jgi:hypothetical protein